MQPLNFNPQFIYGKDGLPTNVVLSYEEWAMLQEQLPMAIPQWQIDESMRRMAAYNANPESAILLDDFLKQLDADDAAEV